MKKLFGAAVAALLLTGSTAAAIPVNWELTPISMGGVTASGGFTYDADLGIFSNIDVDLATPASIFGPANSGAATFLVESGVTPAVTATNTAFSFFSSAGPDFLNAMYIKFNLNTGLTNAGGVLTGGFAEIRTCNQSECLNRFGTIAADPTLTGTPAAVPLPASGLLLLAGLGALAARGRKRS